MMRPWIAPLLALAVAAGTYTQSIGVQPIQAAGTPSRAGAILGLVPVRGRNATDVGTGNLIYHGGPVQTGTHRTYAIYWGSSFSSTYNTLVNGYFQNVAADSGSYNNVYATDTQYYQTLNGSTTAIDYGEQFGGSWSDASLPTTSGCTSTAGGALCLSDAQIEAEVSRAIAANGWPTGLGAEYFVFLANGLSTCSSAGCAFTDYCAYHASYALNGSTVLYANMPYAGHNLSACGSDNYPNGDSAADSTISVISHEANETITDPLGTAWYDQTQPHGYEIGDKCSWNFGAQLGGSAGAQYNQVINGAHYELQQEYSNADAGCILRNYPGRGWGYVWANSPTSASYTPIASYQFNSTGALNTITRSSVGSYAVSFPNLGVAAGTVVVTAYGYGSGACKVGGWGPLGTAQQVSVLCFNSSGAPADTQFTATFTAPHSNASPLAYLWASQPSTASYTPSPVYQFNSAGGTATIQRTGTGAYTVRLPLLGAVAGHVQVTAYGSNADRCQVAGWGPSGTDQLVYVRCFTIAGTPDDTQYTLTYAANSSILGTTPSTGYAWANQPTMASYTPNTYYQFNNAGSAITIARGGTGVYVVSFPGQNLNAGDVQVTAYGYGAAYCNVVSWSAFTGVEVQCYGSSGTALDAYFDVTFVNG